MLPPKADENEQEQSQIRGAIMASLPEGVHYHNVIIVLTELTKMFVEESLLQLVIFKQRSNK